jgi:hypothetical protein
MSTPTAYCANCKCELIRLTDLRFINFKNKVTMIYCEPCFEIYLFDNVDKNKNEVSDQ